MQQFPLTSHSKTHPQIIAQIPWIEHTPLWARSLSRLPRTCIKPKRRWIPCHGAGWSRCWGALSPLGLCHNIRVFLLQTLSKHNKQNLEFYAPSLLEDVLTHINLLFSPQQHLKHKTRSKMGRRFIQPKLILLYVTFSHYISTRLPEGNEFNLAQNWANKLLSHECLQLLAKGNAHFYSNSCDIIAGNINTNSTHRS